ncbi:heat-inducible transcriptional repressor HrcA [Pelotomaculum propionicicum]|uniref:heat-inducible transcriptional repressor HrcA n=1 Tax=Pelotomaculum propionicicum TaxID=258475 RepID=UPI003B7BB998
MDDRKQKVLLAIVQDFIATAEPVGSRTIAKKYGLGVSPATIRNEMADLEEMGYIEQPHTSAGRVPSVRGYRYYVDYLMKKRELTRDEEELIRSQLETKARDVGRVIQRTGNLLSQLTSYTSMVLTQQMGPNNFKHVQLVQMNPSQTMVIVVMDNGAVHNRMIETPESIIASDLETLSKVLNAKLQGLNMETIKITLLKELYFELGRHKHILDLALELIQDSLALKEEDKIYLGGVFNMLTQPEFHNVERVKTMLGILEQEKLLCELLSGESRDEGVTVRIGGEIKDYDIKDYSVVAAPYTLSGRKIGTVGVLGPTRMDYAKVISVVDFLTKNLSIALDRVIFGRGR